jgi:AcrR family transcriptional regulator
MAAEITSAAQPGLGWRERKREQTQQRIAEVGLRLFLEQGYEATTLGKIADEAGIARRTFFHYFDSKEGLLAAYEDEAQRSFHAALARTPNTMPPFEAMSLALLGMVASFGTDEARAIDRLMRSTEALRARRQANYERLEQFVCAALTEKWPEPKEGLRLQMIAMVGVGSMRLAADRWNAAKNKRRVEEYLHEGLRLFATVASS